MTLKAESFNVRKTTYLNAESYKFDNRRITVTQLADGFGLEFRIIDTDPSPHVISEHLRGKIALTRLKLSQEAAEIVMISLAEQMGYTLCK